MHQTHFSLCPFLAWIYAFRTCGLPCSCCTVPGSSPTICLYMLSSPLLPLYLCGRAGYCLLMFLFSVQASYQRSQTTRGLYFTILISIVILHLSRACVSFMFFWVEYELHDCGDHLFHYHCLLSVQHKATRYSTNVCMFGEILNAWAKAVICFKPLNIPSKGLPHNPHVSKTISDTARGWHSQVTSHRVEVMAGVERKTTQAAGDQKTYIRHLSRFVRLESIGQKSNKLPTACRIGP